MSHLQQFILKTVLLALPLIFFSACGSSPTPIKPVQKPTAVKAVDTKSAKIFISQDGMYELTTADLTAAGLNWTGIDPQQLHLFYLGDEQPLWVEEQTVRFYGQARQSRYSLENVYWLQIGSEAGIKMAQADMTEQTQPEKTAESYTAILHAEENNRYSPKVEEGDHWFWNSLIAPGTKSFELTLNDVATGSSRLLVELWSSTEAVNISPDHHFILSMNGQIVADETWDGQTRRTIEADIPPDLLTEGVNRISIEAPGDTGVAVDINLINWLEIYYPRRFVAENDSLTFDFPAEGGKLQLEGFNEPATLFDITTPSQTAIANRTALTPNSRYIAVGTQGYLKPARIIPAVQTVDLQADGMGADYIAIGSPDLLASLAPLLEYRKEQGLSVMAVPVDELYDQFNYGLIDPQAIQTFMVYAAESWQPAPQYLLLLGDYTYDPLGYQTQAGANRLPTVFVSTVYGGETASDLAFAQLDDDNLPDIAIGRIPAQTTQQVDIWVKKTLDYEQQSGNGQTLWQKRIMAIADGQEASFKADAQSFLDLFPPDYTATLIAPEAGEANVNQQIEQSFNDGNLIVAYFGHGSINQWGKDDLFTTKDAAKLSNNNLPVVINMTCLTGLFTHPKVDSLAETLLWQPDGGAVAVLAPTSLTLAVDQAFLSRPLADGLLVSDFSTTIGQSLLYAQRQALVDKQPGIVDVIRTFLLFGDPALDFAKPVH